jgi:hypothetical protein
MAGRIFYAEGMIGEDEQIQNEFGTFCKSKRFNDGESSTCRGQEREHTGVPEPEQVEERVYRG